MRTPSTTPKDNWPPDYVSVWGWRQNQIRRIRQHPDLLVGAKEYYRTRPVEFINHWCDTYDPRVAGTKTPTHMPLILFPKQEELVHFLVALIEGQEAGLIEKARDMGATWVCAAFSVWLWLFKPGAAVGWGSRKQELVDRLGDASSIFEKIRTLIDRLPREFLPLGFDPKKHMSFMKVLNPQTGSSIIGEVGDNIGRGGRTLIYFKDESAHYERPEKIEAALGDNTRVPVDISSVNGVGNVFHRKREAGVEWAGGTAHVGEINVFVMDWSDHPAKTQEWYDTRKRRADREGLSHIFAQEVDRDYSSAVEGIIIPAEWVTSAIDAHKKLGLPEPTGKFIAGLDVADEGGDRNAWAARKGYLLSASEEWGDGDTGKTTRRAVDLGGDLGGVEIQYDSVGVGAGVKAEANRLEAEGIMPKGMRFVPWSAGAKVLSPDRPINERDKDSPLNKDFYANLKAQAWWELRLRFERTHRALNEDGVEFDPDTLISLPSDLPGLATIRKELSQPTASRSTGSLKLVVDKKPEGTRSPNRADAIVMAFWPATKTSGVEWYVGGKTHKC